MKNNWRTREDELTGLAFVLALFVGWLTWMFFRFSFLLGVVIFLIVFFLILARTSPHRRSMVRIFSTTLTDTRRVIKNILDEKGLPYKKSSANLFLLDYDKVEIHILSHQVFGKDISGTVVSLVPQNDESQQLVVSLSQKLDDAFRPRGL